MKCNENFSSLREISYYFINIAKFYRPKRIERKEKRKKQKKEEKKKKNEKVKQFLTKTIATIEI